MHEVISVGLVLFMVLLPRVLDVYLSEKVEEDEELPDLR